jgi:GNAT superfamily N-acetyltransferase
MSVSSSSAALSVRLAGPLDTQVIRRLVERAWRVFRSYDASAWLESMQSGSCWVTARGNEIRGFLAVRLRPFGIARIVAAALANGESATEFAAAILPPMASSLRLHHASSLVHVGDTPWLTEVLEASGFERRETVITYGRHVAAPIAIVGNAEVRLEGARPEMVHAIAAIDRRVFGPVWHKPANDLNEVLAGDLPFVVALHINTIVGYQWYAHADGHAHLNRLAVSPDWQGCGVGARLLTEALASMAGAGVSWVTLNTQQSNARSRRLYERFGFEPVGHPAPLVWKDVV